MQGAAKIRGDFAHLYLEKVSRTKKSKKISGKESTILSKDAMLRLAVDLKATAGEHGPKVSRKKKAQRFWFCQFSLIIYVTVTKVGEGHPKLLLV